MPSLQAGKPRSLGTGAVLIAWRCVWFYIKPLWLDMSQSGSWNNELTFEVHFFAWMKSWSNLIWVSKATPDFSFCWNWSLCSNCLGKQKSHCSRGFKQHLKQWFLCSLWESQPFIQMKPESGKSALLIRNVTAVSYHVCATTTTYFSKPGRTWHPPQAVGFLFVCFEKEKRKKLGLYFIYVVLPMSCWDEIWSQAIWCGIWNQRALFLFDLRQYYSVIKCLNDGQTCKQVSDWTWMLPYTWRRYSSQQGWDVLLRV